LQRLKLSWAVINNELRLWPGATDLDPAAEEGTPFIPPHGVSRIEFVPKPAGFRFYHTHVVPGNNLETYFKILGNINNDKIVAQFEGKEQQICSSFFVESHGIHDDLHVSADEQMTARYLEVFRQFFEKTEHIVITQ
jgi:hypothetical protein